MKIDDPTESLRFHLGSGVVALALTPALSGILLVIDGNLRPNALGWLSLVVGAGSSVTGAVITATGMPSRVGPTGWRRVRWGALVTTPGIGMLLFLLNTPFGGER